MRGSEHVYQRFFGGYALQFHAPSQIVDEVQLQQLGGADPMTWYFIHIAVREGRHPQGLERLMLYNPSLNDRFWRGHPLGLGLGALQFMLTLCSWRAVDVW